MSTPTQAKIDGMRESVINAVVSSYGLPEPGITIYQEKLNLYGFMHGPLYSHANGTTRKECVTKVKKLKEQAKKHGIKIDFKKSGWFPFRSEIETETKSRSYEGEELLHSYEIVSYEIPNLLETIEKAPAHETIEKAIVEKAKTILDLAMPAFSLLPELYEKYVDTAEPVKNAAKASDCKEIYEKIRKNEIQREKETSKVVKLLGLDAGLTYDFMENFAEALLNEKLESIEKGDFVTEMPSAFGKEHDKFDALRIAFKSYNETMNKIDAIRNQFIEKKEPSTPT